VVSGDERTHFDRRRFLAGASAAAALLAGCEGDGDRPAAETTDATETDAADETTTAGRDTATATRTTTAAGPAPTVEGTPKTWHAVSLVYAGPEASEGGSPNPFLDYRLTTTFAGPSGQSYDVPGHYAADGDAAETGAASGGAWRVHFMPDEAGAWTYRTAFARGDAVAVDGGGTPTAFDGDAGTLSVAPTDATGRDLRGDGLLEYVGEHYLRFAGSGRYFLKNGAGSPENVLGYREFDGTESLGGESPDTPSGLHEFAPHVDDWRPGDPTWRGGRGKGIVGAVNYLANVGVNSLYLLTYTIDGGDGMDVWPWTVAGRDAKRRFDVSKLDQWAVVFDHMARRGLNVHVVLQERENDTAMHGGDLGTERRLYYRELVSRFAHHPAVTWNLGEETHLTTDQIREQAAFLGDLDPYGHQVVVHTYPDEWDAVYGPLLGNPDFDGPSIQNGNDSETNDHAKRWRRRSADAGRPWPVNVDEVGHYRYALPCDGETLQGRSQADYRTRSLWPGYAGGAAGLSWYVGTETCQNDRTLEDFRTRADWWERARHAWRLFATEVPFQDGAPRDDALGNAPGHVFADPGAFYVVYLPEGTDGATVDTTGDRYDLEWYDPLTGAFAGGTRTVRGGADVDLGAVPDGIDADAVALLRT
jgi:hypothetical protein